MESVVCHVTGFATMHVFSSISSPIKENKQNTTHQDPSYGKHVGSSRFIVEAILDGPLLPCQPFHLAASGSWRWNAAFLGKGGRNNGCFEGQVNEENDFLYNGCFSLHRVKATFKFK